MTNLTLTVSHGHIYFGPATGNSETRTSSLSLTVTVSHTDIPTCFTVTPVTV
jgi:hypothetical protein